MKNTGIYIAYPTTEKMKSIYRPKNYKTLVNNQHTKVGIAKDSFTSRSKGYYSNFDNEVVFTPLIIIEEEHLKVIENIILNEIAKEYKKVGRAREWFNTTNRERIIDIISNTMINSGISYKFIG